jgi:hypothetical protein
LIILPLTHTTLNLMSVMGVLMRGHRGIEQHPDRGIRASAEESVASAGRRQRAVRTAGAGDTGGLTVSVVLTVFVPAVNRMMYRGRRPAVPH